MPSITLQEAQANLAELVHHLAPGESLTILENDLPIARLVAAAAPTRPRPSVTGVPRAGNCAGLFKVPDDFKEPIEELKEYLE